MRRACHHRGVELQQLIRPGLTAVRRSVDGPDVEPALVRKGIEAVPADVLFDPGENEAARRGVHHDVREAAVATQGGNDSQHR